MRAKDKTILADYRAAKSSFEKIEAIALEKLDAIVQESKIHLYTIEHRIKEEESLAGKLKRKGGKYASLTDITDIMGVRIVCLFADDVDICAKQIESAFTIDWENSIDKRTSLDVNSFGYLSVHYICSLKADGTVPAELTQFRFEVQIRSLIQHVWAVMEHDMGYKTRFGVPKTVSRDFSRLAGLLEIVDEHFTRIRDTVIKYTDFVQTKITNDDANDIPIDSVSLDTYMRSSRNMRSFLALIGNICEADIYDDSAESYLTQLAWLKKETIGDLQNMLETNGSLALQMARTTLATTDLDIFSSTVALRLLCRAELILGEYSQKQAADFFYLSTNDRARAERYAQELFAKKA